MPTHVILFEKKIMTHSISVRDEQSVHSITVIRQYSKQA